MSTTQLNAEFYRNMSIIAEDEVLTKKLMKYLRKLVASKQEDPTLISKEELMTKIEKAENDFVEGRTYAMLPGESFSDFRKRIGL
ncbi:MAG: hypothetical protein J6T52_00230 [Bacteroidaceae bacterium]|nr:hypothetical protein [Bacteroidaceae bacterium]